MGEVVISFQNRLPLGRCETNSNTIFRKILISIGQSVYTEKIAVCLRDRKWQMLEAIADLNTSSFMGLVAGVSESSPPRSTTPHFPAP
jgi:hypothetical protein